MAPLIGFFAALALLFVMKRWCCATRSSTASRRPPRRCSASIRALLIATCTAVSLAHGGNDGQKGMGLYHADPDQLAPTAYALNRTMPRKRDAWPLSPARRLPRPPFERACQARWRQWRRGRGRAKR